MNRSTRAAVTGALVLTAGLTVGGAALTGENPAPTPTPAYVTVEDPAPVAATPDGDCPAAGAATRTQL